VTESLLFQRASPDVFKGDSAPCVSPAPNSRANTEPPVVPLKVLPMVLLLSLLLSLKFLPFLPVAFLFKIYVYLNNIYRHFNRRTLFTYDTVLHSLTGDTDMVKRVNYLNNKDLLAEIHKSKNSYCSYVSDDDSSMTHRHRCEEDQQHRSGTGPQIKGQEADPGGLGGGQGLWQQASEDERLHCECPQDREN
jgi:hypothetical protein